MANDTPKQKSMSVDNFISTIRASMPDESMNMSDEDVFNTFVKEYPQEPQITSLTGLSIPQMATIARMSATDIGNMSDFDVTREFLKEYPTENARMSTEARVKMGLYKVGKALPTAGAITGGVASALAAPGTAGASLLGGSALVGLGAATGKAGEQIISRVVGADAPETPLEAAGEIAKEGTLTAAINAIGGKLLNVMAPTAKLATKQLLRGFARLDERLVGKVLSDPQILSRAKSLEVAQKNFGEFFEKTGFKYGREAVKAATGKRKLSDTAVDDLFNQVLDDIEALGTKAAPGKRQGQVIQDALAARFSANDAIARGVRSGSKEDIRFFTNARNQIDDWLETQMPGFAEIRKEYEEAQIKQAFSHIFPLNKNKEASVLGVLTTLGAVVGGGAISPWAAIPAAVVSSPRAAGAAIRAVGAVPAKPVGGAISELAAKGTQAIIKPKEQE